jgi:hypothetical protein
MDNFLLPLLLIIPTVGAIVCALLPDAKLATDRQVAAR